MERIAPYEVLDAPRCVLGEGARYDEADRELSWVDIPADRAFTRVALGVVQVLTPGRGPAFAFRLDDGARVIVLARGLSCADHQALAVPPGLTEIEAINDGSVHPSGRALIVGSKHVDESDPVGHAWLLTDRWTVLPWRFTVFNGGTFSPDGTRLYFTDSPTGVIWHAEFDCDRMALGEREVFARVPRELGFPDGMACDDEGFLWSAHWGGGCLTRYRPDGTVDRRIGLPAARLTSVAFFGEARNRLAVTSALPDGCLPEELPATDAAGRVFCLLPGVSGPASPRFAPDIPNLLDKGKPHAWSRS